VALRTDAPVLSDRVVGADSQPQLDGVKSFRELLDCVMKVGDSGRTFTDFAPLESDLEHLTPFLNRFELTDNPRTMQERARTCRRLAEGLDFSGLQLRIIGLVVCRGCSQHFWNSNSRGIGELTAPMLYTIS